MKSYQVITEVWWIKQEKPTIYESDLFPSDYLGLDYYRDNVDHEKEEMDCMEGDILKTTVRLISFDEERDLVSNDPELYRIWTENEEVLETTELIYQPV